MLESLKNSQSQAETKLKELVEVHTHLQQTICAKTDSLQEAEAKIAAFEKANRDLEKINRDLDKTNKDLEKKVKSLTNTI